MRHFGSPRATYVQMGKKQQGRGHSLYMNRFSKASQHTAILLGAVSLLFTAGCSSKNYVRSQTAPLVTKTNELDDSVAANNRSIQSTNDRAQAGIQTAQQSANTA